MTRVLAMLLLLAMLGLGRPAATAALPASVRIGGQYYVPVGDWARGKGFTVRWIKRDEKLSLTKGSMRVELATFSREAIINSVRVYLLYPPIRRNDLIYLTRLDAEATLEPLLATGRKSSAAMKTICLDPGHGGKDPGFMVGSRAEKTYTLLLAKELQQQLTRAGFKVSLTRTDDRLIDLPDRPELARKYKADLFLSLHFNAVGGSTRTVRGAEVYSLTPAGAPSTNARGGTGGSGTYAGNRFDSCNVLLAYHLQRALSRVGGVEDRGVHRARFAVLRDARMPAVLIEAGFMSHPVEGSKIFTALYRRDLAKAIVAGVLEYKKVAACAN